MSESNHFKICKLCNEKIVYKTIGSYYANRNKLSPCRKCKNILHSSILKGRPRPKFSDEWKKNIGEGHKKSKAWKDSMNTIEYKTIHREKMLRMIKNNKTSVAFNPVACRYFDILNSILLFDGRHGLNAGEKQIIGYFPDFYDVEKNIIIEWDEAHHNKPNVKSKDIIRQNRILEHLNCQFYRIDEKNKLVYKVDNNSTNITNELQEILNEFNK